ncbi:hypothetical protein QQ056_18830 [Oscillatoria laete-virens NRMC-F 0139]|nr:hypothetical protein [Oscillatoria laete-virens NRMC-F 0139]
MIVLLVIFLFGMSAYALQATDMIASGVSDWSALAISGVNDEVRCVFVFAAGAICSVFGLMLSVRKRRHS